MTSYIEVAMTSVDQAINPILVAFQVFGGEEGGEQMLFIHG